jgi:DNA (cytosine-5)-methyltransferase 1
MLPVEGFRMRAFGSYVNDETASAMKMRDYKDATDLVAIGLDEEQNALVDGFGTLKARTEGGGFEGSVMQSDMQVRRLTPKECARLQGFSDDYLDIGFNGKPAADGPKYKALGNSMAVPVMAWLGSRLQNG